MWEKIKTWTTHKNLREVATTLNFFNLIEISILGFVAWQVFDLLQWYKDTVTAETFNGVAFWGAIGSLIAGLFGALKYINHTYEARKGG